jgi:hypothetical protein
MVVFGVDGIRAPTPRAVIAEFTYIAMYEVMPAEVRCAWQDVGDLLAPSDRSAYDKTSCAARAEMHATLWWLSDPLFRVQGNERWVVHQSRHVDVALRSALDGDERYAWNLERGGDALARLLVRYGWPSYTWWDGRLTDNNHSGYLRNKLSTPVPPYTTFEYSMDRVHLLPLRRVLANPLAASDADWELSGVTPAGEIDPGWWSAEHFRTPRRLVQLPEGQTVMLRRQTNIEIASAHRMRQPLMVRDSQRYDVMLLSSTSRNDIDTLAQRGAGSGETAVLRSTIPGAASLLAVEAMGSERLNWMRAPDLVFSRHPCCVQWHLATWRSLTRRCWRQRVALVMNVLRRKRCSIICSGVCRWRRKSAEWVFTGRRMGSPRRTPSHSR